MIGKFRLPAEALPGVLLPEPHGLHRVQVSTLLLQLWSLILACRTQVPMVSDPQPSIAQASCVDRRSTAAASRPGRPCWTPGRKVQKCNLI
jgi:hypothetical protein